MVRLFDEDLGRVVLAVLFVSSVVLGLAALFPGAPA